MIPDYFIKLISIDNNSSSENPSSIPVGWNDLPADVIREIFNHTIPETLLGLHIKQIYPKEAMPSLLLLNKQADNILSDNTFWETKYKKHFPKAYKLMPESQRKAIKNWRKEFVKTRNNEFELQDNGLHYKVDPYKKQCLAKIYSAVAENDFYEFKKLLNDYRQHFENYPIPYEFSIAKLFLHDNENPISEGSILRLARRNKNQDILNELYSLIETSLKENSSKKDPIEIQKLLIYWAIHCLQPIELIDELLKYSSRMDYVVNEHSQCYPYEPNLLPIHVAAEAGYEKLISHLLAQDNPQDNILLNMPCDEINFTPLECALVAGEPEAALILINAGANLNPHDGSHKPPFHIAAENGLLNVMEAMLAKDPALLNQIYKERENTIQTALERAIVIKQVDAALWLLSKGATFSYPAVNRAIQNGLLSVIEKMWEIDCKCIHENETYMSSPLCIAVMDSKLEIMEFLIEKGVIINIENPLHNPLLRSLKYKSFAALLLLLSHEVKTDPLQFTNNYDINAIKSYSRVIDLLSDLVKYINENSSPDAVATDAYIVATALRDMIYKYESPDSLDKIVIEIITSDDCLSPVYNWYKNEYYKPK